MIWTIYDYVEPSGRVPFFEWLMGLSDEAQAWVDARLLQMAGMARWSEKWASKYKGTKKLIELRIPFNRVQYRPLGMYAPSWSFVLLAGAIEKDGKIPRPTIEAAVRRQEALENGNGHVRRHRIN